MSEYQVSGSCLCGEVQYQISGHMGMFQYCHCSRCRKVTGSAHASNLFVKPEQFRWTQGEEFVGRYEPATTKYFATCFCKKCGCNLPWLSKSHKVVIIPAGGLDGDPQITPSQNIFWGSKACWYAGTEQLPHNEEMPPRG